MHEHTEDCGCDNDSLSFYQPFIDDFDINTYRLRSLQERIPTRDELVKQAASEFAANEELVQYPDIMKDGKEVKLVEVSFDEITEVVGLGTLADPVDVDKINLVKTMIALTDLPITIVFQKADGSERTLVHKKTVQGLSEERSERAEKQVTSRKKNNPNLISVFDSVLNESGTPAAQCWRSVKIESIKTVSTGDVLLSLG